nr:MAG TPA: hypothetical protein [Caudoviricetes sp.]
MGLNTYEPRLKERADSYISFQLLIAAIYLKNLKFIAHINA